MISDNNKKLLVLCFVYITESMNLYVLYPFVAFLLVHYGVINNVNEAGLYSGFFTSIYSLSQMLSCGFWGKMSDAVGKKNVIFFGLTTSSVLYLFFGFCNNLYLALFIRFLIGLLNSNSPIIKSYIADISNNDNKAKNYNFITISWCIGIVVGSLIGGNAYNLIFKSYPVLIISIISFCIYCISACVLYFFIQEEKKNCNILEYIKNGKYNFLLFDIIDLWQYKNIIYSIMIYVFATITDISTSEFIPLWMVSSKESGGLNYNSNEISYIFTICSVLSIMIQPLYFILDVSFSRLTMFRVFIIINAILIFLIPYCNELDNSFLYFTLLNTLRYVVISWMFSLIYLMISFSTEDKSKIGHINGVAQSLGSVCKILSPIVFNPLFSLTSNKKISHLDHRFVFCIIALIYIVPFVLSFYIQKSNIDKQNDIPIQEDIRVVIEEEIICNKI